MNDISSHALVYVPHPCLDQPVDQFPKGEIENRHMISQHMISIMNANKGVGLAANQINLNAMVHVQKIQSTTVAMFNPAIIEISETKLLMTEGCLSDPGMFLKIKRPATIKIQYEDTNENIIELQLDGMDCRVFLHEFDHLSGILFTDRVGPTKLAMGKIKQRNRLHKWVK